MKKIIVTSLLVMVALVVLSTGVVFAQENQPPTQPRGQMQGGVEGPLHEYMVKALAEMLGLSTDQLEARLDGGETAYQIALAQGIAAEEIPALLSAARAKALDSAVAAGAITQEQADWMKSRGSGQGRGSGMGTGTCDGTGTSQMHSGWRWQQTTP
jgi:hypothetical protein